MSPTQQAALAADLSDDLQRRLASEVLSFPAEKAAPPRIRLDSPLADHADMKRRLAHQYKQLAADVRRQEKADLAVIAAEEKADAEAIAARRALRAEKKSQLKAEASERASGFLIKAAGAEANCAAIDKHL